MVKVLVLFYSTYGHIYTMAKAAADAAKEIEGAEVSLKRVPETLQQEVLEKMGAVEAQKQFEHVPIVTVEDIANHDVIIFGVPTRFGMMAAQMKTFMDSLVSHWASGATVGKLASVFTSSATQHGGQESTILSFHTVLLHLGFLISGLPYTFTQQNGVEEVKGCSPYGASTIADNDGSRLPSETEIAGMRFQAKHATEIGLRLIAGKK